MGFLSSVMGGGTNTSTSTTGSSLPDWFNNYGQNLFGAATDRFLNASYPGAYTGTRVAGSNPDLESSAAAVRGMQGGADPFINQAQNLTSQGGELFNQNDFNSFMNPYTEQVSDRIATLGARNLSEKLLPTINANFITSGNFGSSQNTDFTQRALRDTQESVLGQQAQAMEQGFNTSLGAYNAGQQRRISAGQQMGALGQLKQQTGLRDAAALEEIGKDTRNQAQRQADVGYGDYVEGRDWGRNMLQGASNIGQGYTPPSSTTTNTSSTTGGTTGGLGSLLGGAAAVGSVLPWDKIGNAASSVGSWLGFKRGGHVGALRQARGARAPGALKHARGGSLSFATPRLPPLVSGGRSSVGALRRAA